jgi:hypothetical protein
MPGSPIRLADKSLFFRAFCKIQLCSDWQFGWDATIPSITTKSKHFSDFSRDAIFSMQHAASNLFCVCQHEAPTNFSPASENLHTNGSQCIIKDIFRKGRPTYMNLSTKAFCCGCRENTDSNLASILLENPRTEIANCRPHLQAQRLDQFGIVGARRAKRLRLPGHRIA